MTTGELCALGCAAAWSVAVVLFKKAGDSVSPVVMNLFKNTLGFVLMVPTVWVVEGALVVPTEAKHVGIMLFSGVLGIGIADALVLKSLSLIGATRWAIVECLYAPIVIALSMLFFAERLTLVQIGGAVLVLSAVVCVSSPGSDRVDRASLVKGSAVGIAGLVAMAVGILGVKPVFDEVPLMWVIEVRLLGGVLGSIVSVVAAQGFGGTTRALLGMERKGTVLAASLCSTYFAMILWVAGFKYADASIAAILNQTSTIFTVALAVVFLRERMTWAKVLGTVLAVVGVLAIAVDWSELLA